MDIKEIDHSRINDYSGAHHKWLKIHFLEFPRQALHLQLLTKMVCPGQESAIFQLAHVLPIKLFSHHSVF
jgi:hypothetical protein